MDSTPQSHLLGVMDGLREEGGGEDEPEDSMGQSGAVGEMVQQSGDERPKTPEKKIGCDRGERPKKVTAKSLMLLLEKQGFCCALTGRVLTPDIAEVDHMLPYSRGGLHEISNVQVVHIDANRAKGTMSNEEFIALCCEVANHAKRNRPGPSSLNH